MNDVYLDGVKLCGIDDKEETNVEKHMRLCANLNIIYENKNRDYGNSFSKSYEEYGMTMVCIRLEDKLNRIKSLTIKGNKQMVNDESVIDSLKDLANYALMAVMELEE